MQRALTHASLVLLLITVAPPVWSAADAQVTIDEQERAQLLDLMVESKTTFLALLAGTSDAQWNFKPSPDRWSVGECAEHIMRSNEALFQSAKAALATAANPDWETATKGKSEFLMQVMPNRNPGGAGGASAPQEIRPTGEPGREEIVERFLALYGDVTRLIESSDQPLKAHTYEHPFPIFGTLSAYDWILYVPLHTIRHSKQAIEVMETAGYPSE